MTAPEKAIFVLSLAAALAASASGASIERPSTVVKTDDGWRIVYALGAPVKVDYFTLSNAPAGAWSLTVDSWEFARGEKLPENLSTNLPKAVSASRFQFEVKGGADPKMGGLLLETADLSDRTAVEALRRLYVEKKGDRIFADFGGETAVRGVYVPAGSSVEVYGSWSPSLADGGLGSPILASRTEKDGRLYVEFHDVQRFCYFAVTGVGAPKDIEFDVVPYGYAKHLTNETWEQKLERMKWWTDARFGMFIHFGLYAVPARHEWVKSNERIGDERYREYFETFNPSRFDAKAWAKAAKGAGMKYAVLTSRHHEGFSLFDTKFSDYKITNTPFGRDLVKEFVDAFRAEGLKVGFYYSLLDWHHPDYTIDKMHPRRRNPEMFGAGGENVDYSKENEGRDMAKYRQFMKNQVTELLTNYGKIDIIWFDFSFPGKNGKDRYDWDSEGLVRLAKKLQPEIIIDNRLDLTDWEDGWDFATPEQSRPAGCVEVNGRKVPWETCQTFSGSWGYARDESSWKSAYQCIEQLVDAVSKGGNVIMNVGPTATGEFDYRALERLADYGKWLRVNGESIYGCGPAPEEFAPLPGTTLTYNPKTNRLYMHMLSWRFGAFQVPFGERVKCCRLLNDGSELRFRWNTLHLPVEKPPVEIPVVEFILK